MINDSGTVAAAGRIAFDDGLADTMPVEWAERMLRNWRQRQPAQFGAALAEAATGVAVSARRSRRGDRDGQAGE